METGVFQPAPPDYMALQYLDKWSGGRLFGILNDHAARGLSICPVCKIGDFGHSDGCGLDLTEADMKKIQGSPPVGKIIAKKAMKNRTRGARP